MGKIRSLLARASSPRVYVPAAVVLVVAVVLAAWLVASGRGDSAPKAATTPAPKPTPTRHAPQHLLSPFPGEPVKSLGPVLAVKIDNIAEARPPTGLTHADIV